MAQISGRMVAIMRELVLEARRSGLKQAEVDYESFAWNDEGDKVHCRIFDHENRISTMTMEV